MLTDKKVPNAWEVIHAKMIYKKGDKLDPSNHIIISLVKSIIKVFTQILNNRLMNWIQEKNILPDSQSGFRKGRGCLDNVFSSNAIIQLYLRRKGGKHFALSVDLEWPFDLVLHDLIWTKLFSIDVSIKFINILKDLYSKANVGIKGRAGISKYTEVPEGILREEMLSHPAFSLCISDFEKFLKSKCINGVSITHTAELLSSGLRQWLSYTCTLLY